MIIAKNHVPLNHDILKPHDGRRTSGPARLAPVSMHRGTGFPLTPESSPNRRDPAPLRRTDHRRQRGSRAPRDPARLQRVLQPFNEPSR
jgi:hypothetical protein